MTRLKLFFPYFSPVDLSRRLILEEFDADCKLKDVTDSLSRPSSRHSNSSCSFSSSNLESLRDIDVTSHKQVGFCEF